MLPYRTAVSVKPMDPERYTFQLAKAVALVRVAIGLGIFEILHYCEMNGYLIKPIESHGMRYGWIL